MDYLIILVPLLPLLAAIFSQIFAPQLKQYVARVSVVAAALTFVAACTLLSFALAGHGVQEVSFGTSWGVLLFDPLSSLMAVVISGISLIVHVYSVRYMLEEEGYGRFFILLDVMTSALLMMVAAGDLITLLVVWHLIGVVLYFLLGHDTSSHTVQRYAFWTLFTYRIGDLPLLIAAGLLYDAYGTLILSDLFKAIEQQPHISSIMGLTVVEVSGWLIAIAAFARSAQFLMHTWLPYTMSGPTPVSALMHAGIVNAGGFLINRFAPLYVHTSDVLHGVFIVGLITSIVGSVLMLTQNDVKKALGYSTMGQMGFMIMECGVGAFSLAIYHLIAHGVFKGTLFLSAGNAIHDARKNDGVPKQDMYTFVVERKTETVRQSWLMMAAITLIVPLVLLLVSHWLVAQDFFQKQGAIVLLFFGWVTGAQLMFATYKMRATHPWRLIGIILLSFTIVVIGYTVISHAFDTFLYPDPAFSHQIYLAAGVDLFWFDILVVAITATMVLSWLITYYKEKHGGENKVFNVMWLNFYALISREFHIMDIYAWISRKFLGVATRLNTWLRWV